ncbi:MAG: zinc metalloprotease [Chitinophagaceae bacterium]
MRKAILLTLLHTLFWGLCEAQRHCATPVIFQNTISRFPELREQYGFIERMPHKSMRYLREVRGIITIPVVVHVVYRTAAQKVSMAQISSQIEVLNEDFSGTNEGVNNVPDSFRARQAHDCGIRFRLDSVIWVPTTVAVFYFNTNPLTYKPDADSEPIKFASKGGSNVVTPTVKLNIWVGNIMQDSAGRTSTIEGISSVPGSAEQVDGVAVNFRNFGRINLDPPFNRGRTATHEVGHWLNLRHIWGDTTCGDDLIEDTPPQQTYNRNCFEGIKISCNNAPLGDMYMNYMDYVDDACMRMFTREQALAMRKTFAQYRPGLLQFSSFDSSFTWSGISFISAGIQEVVQQSDTAFISLFKTNQTDLLNVYLKEVRGSNWISLSTGDSALHATGFRPGVLYELKVQNSRDTSKKFSELPSIIFMPQKDEFKRRPGHLTLTAAKN